ncbi:MAG TPA: cytochrome c oxidase subunit II [Candidatus Binatia bacterium]|jgi:cytochrome c oxidase subunit 2|nr:cytochrome c oxidase subunit II [Candidatus Binatia bacterium]
MLDWWLPHNVSAQGPFQDIDWLFHVIYWVTGGVFLVVQAALLAFVVRYRARPGRRATYTHGNTRLEIIWTVAPSILLVMLALFSRSIWADIKEHVPPTDMTIQVTAKQFNWEVAYPGPDGKFGTADDVTQDNDVHVPAGKTIRVVLRSRDVIHSFFLPNLRFKQDAVPGHEIPVWFKVGKMPAAGTTDKYEIPCAELCGFGHSGMRGWLYVHTPEDYAAWAHANHALAAAPATQPGA